MRPSIDFYEDREFASITIIKNNLKTRLRFTIKNEYCAAEAYKVKDIIAKSLYNDSFEIEVEWL